MSTRKTRAQLDAEMGVDQPSDAPEGEKEGTVAEEAATETTAAEEVTEEVTEEVVSEEEAVEEEAVEEEAAEEEAAEEAAAEDEAASEPEEGLPSEAASEPEEGLPSQAASEAEEGPPLDASLEHRLLGVLESLLFAAAEPVPLKRLAQVVREFHAGVSSQKLRKLLERLRDELREQGRGLRISEVAGSFQLRTPSETAPYIKKLVTSRPPRLTRATLETLAIVAYRQPVTRPEIEDIRGVDCGAVLKHLLEKRLVKILGRKDEVGRPLLYATSQDFLEFFGLRDLKSLPTLKDFVELSDEHRAQLGLSPIEEAEAKAREGAEIPTSALLPDSEDAFVPIGQDEVITELAQALDDVRMMDRELIRSGALPGASKKKAAGEEEGEEGEEGEGGGEKSGGETEEADQGEGVEAGGGEEVKEEPPSAPEGATEGAPASAPEGADMGAEPVEDPKGSGGLDG